MLDLPRLERIRLRPVPWGQRIFAPMLATGFHFPPRTTIRVEGLERIPQDRSVFLAMNHTDRYNYWPLQWKLHQQGLRYTATWVKGKYYQNPLMAWFMDVTGNIPLPSRGYVVSVAFQQGTGRPPTREEYRALRDRVDGQPVTAEPQAVAQWLADCGGPEAWAEAQRQRFSRMMDEVMRINREAMEAGLHVLVFPEGTRRVRLGKGHTGLIQTAWHLGAAVVPIGCNGCHRVYPGDSPWPSGGEIVYRVGEVLEPDGPELGPLRVREPYTPFTRAASARHGQAFQAGTDVVMAHIAALLDPEHLPLPEEEGGGGAERFL